MKKSNAIPVILASFFKSGLKATRTRVFIMFSLIPVLLMFIVRMVDPHSAGDFFSKVMLSLYFQLLIPVLALFFGTTIVNEELDNKTLVYLTTCPVARQTILVGKYLAAFMILLLVVGSGFLFSFLAAAFNRLNQASAWEELGVYLGTSLLALFCYSALFTMAGTFMKKSILLGLFFIFGWESVVQYFPGVTQKFTIIHWIKSLLPVQSSQGGFLIFQLQPSPVFESIAVLIGAGLFFLALAVFIFKHREYILSDNA